MSSTMVFRYTDPTPGGSGTTTLSFNAALVAMTQPRYSPIQRINIAESGEVWVYQLSPTVELEHLVEITDLPTATQSTPAVTDGYTALYQFLASVVNWAQHPFTVTDPDGDTFTLRYMQGFETLREAAGRSGRADRWSGQLVLRRVV